MWLVHALRDSFATPLPARPLEIFRLVFAAALLLKFMVEASRGYWHYLDPDRFLGFVHTLRKDRWVDPNVYRRALLLRPLAALGLLLGLGPRVCALLLVCTFVIELRVYFKFHACYFLLIAAALATEPNLGQSMAVTLEDGALRWTVDPHATHSGLAAALVVVTSAAMYVFTARHKFRSADFRSGRVVHCTLIWTRQHGHQRRRADGVLPGWLSQFLVEGDPAAVRRRWQVLATVTVALEAVLPLALLLPTIGPVAAVAGALMHLGFTAMFPLTLAHFSLVTVGSYLLFFDPHWVTHLSTF